MQNPVIKRFELVELLIPAGVIGKVLFPSIATLRNQSDQQIIINDVDIFTAKNYSNSQSNGALAGFAEADIPKGVLVLYVNGEESIHLIPLSMLIHNPASADYQTNSKGFANLTNVDFDKSYVQFSVATSNNASVVLPLGVSYLKNVRDPNNANAWIQV